jgi:hypothetical protein
MTARKPSLAANSRHVAANRWQSAAFCGVAARRLVRKLVSMEALERRRAHNRACKREIPTPVQSLATHSRATRRTRDESFDPKSDIAKST